MVSLWYTVKFVKFHNSDKEDVSGQVTKTRVTVASDFSVRHAGSQAIKIPRETDCHPGILYSAGPPIKYKGQIKMFTLKRTKQEITSMCLFSRSQ